MVMGGLFGCGGADPGNAPPEQAPPTSQGGWLGSSSAVDWTQVKVVKQVSPSPSPFGLGGSIGMAGKVTNMTQAELC